MAPAPMDPAAEDKLRAEASDWFARMRGSAADRHRPGFEAWLAVHPNHQVMYERIELRWQQSALLAHSRAGQARAGLPARRHLLARPAARYAIAAALVGAVGLGSFAMLSPNRGLPGRPAPTVAGTDLANPVGPVRRLRLADGTVVTLDTDTRLAVLLGAEARRVRLLRGRARFAVAHDAGRPFIVAAGAGEVVATGTVFDVSVVEGAPRVTLLEGAVEVRPMQAASGKHAPGVRLRPGQTIAIAEPAPQPARGPEADWTSGMLSFDGRPLHEVLAEANRYSARPITLADPALGDLRVTGAFRVADASSLATALAAALGLRVEPGVDGAVRLARR
jgi:transmembrane sensor